jgi:hypothetical protein
MFPPGSYPTSLPPGAILALPPGYGPVPFAPPGYLAPPAPRPAPAVQAQVPKPVVRAQAPDDIVPQVRTSLAMPAPDQLGVSGRPADGCDWTVFHRRLQDLGAISYQVDRLNADVYQFTCLLPTKEAGRTHRIEAHGATEGEAVRRALDEAERWSSQK